MARLKLKRFRVKEPPPEVQARYIRAYSGRDLYFRPAELPSLAPEVLFGRSGPLVIDLGSGRGEFLVSQAVRQPDTLFVGFEWHLKSVWDAANRAHTAELDNVCFVKADLRQALALVPDAAVSEAFMLFPPPRVKPSERKRDMLAEATLCHLHRVLVTGGLFHFVTDHADYFEAKRQFIAHSGRFVITGESRTFEGGVTRFQRFWEGFSIESRRLECRKKGE